MAKADREVNSLYMPIACTIVKSLPPGRNLTCFYQQQSNGTVVYRQNTDRAKKVQPNSYWPFSNYSTFISAILLNLKIISTCEAIRKMKSFDLWVKQICRLEKAEIVSIVHALMMRSYSFLTGPTKDAANKLYFSMNLETVLLNVVNIMRKTSLISVLVTYVV